MAVLHLAIEFRLLVEDVLFDELLLRFTQVEFLHLLDQHLPGY